LLAIVSVCAFAIVLIDQIAEKLSFELTRSSAQQATSSQLSGSLLSDAIGLFKQFAAASPPIEAQSAPLKAAQLTGSLAGFLSASLPTTSVDTDVSLQSASRLEADMIIGAGNGKILVELKMTPPSESNIQRAVEQVLHYGKAAGIDDAIVYFHPADPRAEMVEEERKVHEERGRIFVVHPKKRGNG
jgi:hypothetical protein